MAVVQDLLPSKKYATQFEISVEESSRRREENAAHWKIRGDAAQLKNLFKLTICGHLTGCDRGSALPKGKVNELRRRLQVPSNCFENILIARMYAFQPSVVHRQRCRWAYACTAPERMHRGFNV